MHEDLTFFLESSYKATQKGMTETKFFYGGIGNVFHYKTFYVPFRKSFIFGLLSSPTKPSSTVIGGEFEFLPGIYLKKFYYALDLMHANVLF